MIYSEEHNIGLNILLKMAGLSAIFFILIMNIS